MKEIKTLKQARQEIARLERSVKDRDEQLAGERAELEHNFKRSCINTKITQLKGARKHLNEKLLEVEKKADHYHKGMHAAQDENEELTKKMLRLQCAKEKDANKKQKDFDRINKGQALTIWELEQDLQKTKALLSKLEEEDERRIEEVAYLRKQSGTDAMNLNKAQSENKNLKNSLGFAIDAMQSMSAALKTVI